MGPVIRTPAAARSRSRGHHDQRLDVAAAALAKARSRPTRPRQAIWRDEPLRFHEQRFALVEAISHLERLAATGRAFEYRPARWRGVEAGV